MLYPKENICPICGTDRTKLNGIFFGINGEAMEFESEGNANMTGDNVMGFLNVYYHNHDNMQGFDIVENSDCGQFEFTFCSIECMQLFFDQIINEIKRKIINS